ncbi:MAG: hypothetical protein A2044_02055 [Candidatus Firestonebacteria bacterium GWA2_43_8]|nr:MAG: hypothetical protein A2044_02055 [Candidatus Firestonebacteria bacterium GWA2_43_8]
MKLDNQADIKRICTFLKPGELEYLDNISKKSKFTGGAKLSRTKILRALVKAMREMKIDVTGVKTEDQLKKRILRSKIL